MENHSHGEDGSIVYEATDPSAAEVEAVEEIASAEVRIAEINAKRDVDLAKLSVKAVEVEDTSELDQLRGEVKALREMVDLIRGPVADPEQEPAPVVVEAPAPFDEEPAVDEPPVVENQPPKQKKSKGVSWF